VRTETGGHMIVNDGVTVTVKSGGQFDASRDMFIGSALPTFEGAGGDAHLILDGGTSLTRTGGSGGDLFIGGPTGTGRVTIRNNGNFTTHNLATNGVQFKGDGVLTLGTSGTLATRKINKAPSDAGNPGTAIILFDGGNIVANVLPTGGIFIDNTIDHIYVATGGATINTNGFNLSITKGFTHDPNTAGVDGGFTKLGAGTLTMNVDNTHTGPTIIKGGTLATNNQKALGESGTAPSNFIIDGGAFEFNASATTINRGLTVGDNGATLRSSSGAWRLQGAVTGNGTLFIDGNVYFGGTNTGFTGNIEVLKGEFFVRRSTSLGTTSGGVIVHNGAMFGLDHNGTAGGGNDNTLNDYKDDLTLKNGGILSNRGGTGTAAFYSGDVELESGTGIVDVVSNVLTIQSEISGAGGLTKTGAGRLVVTQQNIYAGKTTISAGTLALGGNASLATPWIEIYTNAIFDVTASSPTPALTSSTLSGTGTITGSITLGQDALLKPGGSSLPDNLSTAGDQTGLLAFTHHLQLTANAQVHLQLASATEYDQLSIGQNFTTGSANDIYVTWTGGYEAVLNDTFNLIDWTGTFTGFDLSRLHLPTFTDSSLHWLTNNFLIDGTISVGAVPEPGRSLMLTLTLGLLILRRRR
jgi:fibronectin-binding autotransporter adhesin